MYKGTERSLQLRILGEIGLLSLAKGKPSAERDTKCICLCRNAREGEESFKFSYKYENKCVLRLRGTVFEGWLL